jgi:polar amino acid transport system substrate-binding protein
VNEPPLSIATAEKVSGVDPEIMRAFLADQGVETVDGVLVEFASLIPALVAGRLDAISSGLFIRPARCEQIAFSDPTIQIDQVFVVKKGNPLNLHSLKDVVASPTAKLGGGLGQVELEWADVAGVPKDRQVAFPTSQEVFTGLQAGRVDVALGNTLSMATLLEQLNDPNLELAPLSEQPVDADGNTASGYPAMGFRKEDADFQEAFNAWLKEARSSGKLLEIIAPFGITQEMIPPDDATAEELCQP